MKRDTFYNKQMLIVAKIVNILMPHSIPLPPFLIADLPRFFPMQFILSIGIVCTKYSRCSDVIVHMGFFFWLISSSRSFNSLSKFGNHNNSHEQINGFSVRMKNRKNVENYCENRHEKRTSLLMVEKLKMFFNDICVSFGENEHKILELRKQCFFGFRIVLWIFKNCLDSRELKQKNNAEFKLCFDCFLSWGRKSWTFLFFVCIEKYSYHVILMSLNFCFEK